MESVNGRCLVVLAWAPLLALGGCREEPRPAALVRAFLAPAAEPGHRSEAVFVERGGPGRIRYLGLSVVPASPSAGDALELSHVFEVERPFSTDPSVFVHLEAAGTRYAVADHRPVEGRVPFSAMKAKERWLDVHRISIPPDAPRGLYSVWVGLFDGPNRMTVEAGPGSSDGRDRVLAVQLPVAGLPPPGLPEVLVPRARGRIEPDGVLDEPDWGRAPVLEMSDTLGRPRPIQFPTRLRLLYDDDYLYVAFEAEDRDVREKHTMRDAPIYEFEAVELFLMPGVAAPDTGPYVELQASPTGVIFDASFDGPRQGMNRSYDAGQTVGTKVDGTLNDGRPDRGWTSEWKVPWTGIRGVTGPPAPGAEWRMNAFRVESFRDDGEERMEYSAWSPPRVGDFHAVDRFGRMRFSP